jgi:hypothetical protein
MSFFSSVKRMFTKKNRGKEKDIEMVGKVNPVYRRKVIGVSPRRNHRVMNSPPLRKSNRRGRHPLGPLSPIESISENESSSRRNSSSSSSRHRLPGLKIPSSSSSTPYSLTRSKSNSRSRSKSKSRSRSKSKSRSRSKSRSKSSGSNNSFYISPLSKSRSKSRSRSRSKSKSRSRSKSKSRSKSSSTKVNTRRRIPRRQKKQPHTTHAKRKIYRKRIKNSQCRGIKPGEKCKRRPSCKYAMGEKRQFCRKKKNTAVNQR